MRCYSLTPGQFTGDYNIAASLAPEHVLWRKCNFQLDGRRAA
jgi:hypothetical protein